MGAVMRLIAVAGCTVTVVPRPGAAADLEARADLLARVRAWSQAPYRDACAAALPGSKPGPSSRTRRRDRLRARAQGHVHRRLRGVTHRVVQRFLCDAQQRVFRLERETRSPSAASTTMRAPLVRNASAWSASVAARPSRSRLLGRSACTSPRSSCRAPTWFAARIPGARCAPPRRCVDSAAARAASTRLNSVCVAASCSSRATRFRSSTTASRCDCA